MDNQRNLILAIVLSLAVLFGWQFFIAGPQLSQQQQADQAQQAAATAASGAPGAPATTAAGTPSGPVPAGTPAETTALTRDQALAQSAARVPVMTAAVSGSINLAGGRLDDLSLDTYHETTDPKSPAVVLLSPSGAPDAYFVDFAWTAAAGSTDPGPLPGATTLWTAPAGATLTTATPVTLTYDNGAGLTFTRTFAVDDKYMFTVTDAVKNSGAAAVSLVPTGKVTRVGEPSYLGTYILHIGLIGVTDKLEMIGYNDMKKDKEKVWNGVGNGWVGITDKYWAAALIPDKTQPWSGRFAYTNSGSDVFEADYSDAPLAVAPGSSATASTHLFAGAKQVALVDAYTAQYGINLFDHLIDWGYLWFFTKPFFYVIDFLYQHLGNFGLAILATTVLLKALFFPLANRSYRSMAAMRKMQPQLATIKERYKDDKVKQQQATMELYKKERVNPLAGCWPVALQIPVFFSLYSVLYVTIEMRQAPFFGWIQDLAAPDPTNVFNLFGLLPFNPASIPIIGGALVIGAWPLIMGITMFIQMKLNPTPVTDPTQQVIFTWMPLLFTFMLSGFPAGLVIYYSWNNTLSVTQQYFIMRRHGTNVNLLGNIRNSFRPNRAAAEARARAAAPPPATVTLAPANDTGVAAAKKAKKQPRQAGAKG